MTFSLTKNFFGTARGLTFKDSASVTWSFNQNTNEITATGGGGGGSGTVTSVALADGSSTAIYTITGSPVIAAGTLTFSLKTQAANLVLAGPTTGAAAQPTFRSLVVADLPTGIPNANLANSSLTVAAGAGLSGGGPVSLGGSVSLSLTSPVTAALGGTGQAGGYTIGDLLYASGAAVLSKLADVAAGQYLRSGGVGAPPSWGVIPAGDLPSNGANPTASVGLVAVNGSATTWMRSDAAPPLDVTISPTWTGNHHFNPTAGTAIQSTVPLAGTFAAITDGTVTGTMNFAGTAIQFGTTSAHALTLNSGGTIRITVSQVGAITIAKADSGTALLTVAGGVANSGHVFDGSTVTSGYKLLYTITDAGATILTNSASRTLALGTNSTARLTIGGSGGIILDAPTGGNQGVGTVNISTGYYINGVLQQTYGGDTPLLWMSF